MDDIFAPHPTSLFCSCASCHSKRKDYIMKKTNFMIADLDALEWPEEARTMEMPADFSGIHTVVARLPTKKGP